MLRRFCDGCQRDITDHADHLADFVRIDGCGARPLPDHDKPMQLCANCALIVADTIRGIPAAAAAAGEHLDQYAYLRAKQINDVIAWGLPARSTD